MKTNWSLHSDLVKRWIWRHVNAVFCICRCVDICHRMHCSRGRGGYPRYWTYLSQTVSSISVVMSLKFLGYKVEQWYKTLCHSYHLLVQQTIKYDNTTVWIWQEGPRPYNTMQSVTWMYTYVINTRT